MKFTEFFTPRAIALNWSEVADSNIAYVGEALFPARKKAGLDLAWLKGASGLPISLMPSAFDAKATFRDRIGVSKIETEMPFFREGFKIKEVDRQELLRAADANDPYAQQVIARVFDDANNLIKGANVVAERERMSLLFAEGGDVGIQFDVNGVNYTYDYDPDDEWKSNNYYALAGTALWTASSTADPLANIQTALDDRRNDTGAIGEIAIMNNHTFGLMANTDAVKNRYLTLAGTTLGYLTPAEVKSIVENTLGIQIIVNDAMYRDEGKVAHKFVPDGYVAIVPGGSLGSTWYGTTPEEADLMGSGQADVSIVNTGVAISREVTVNPVNVNTFASEIVLPSYERMMDVSLLKVIA